ncbi:MAG: hypothetical protein JRI68_08715 [Deltaproteobacteria bacterium]|nr:hypothetical protein [Deltaproteobacteria bacterium]
MGWPRAATWAAVAVSAWLATGCDDPARQASPDPQANTASSPSTSTQPPPAPSSDPRPPGFHPFDGSWVVQARDGTQLARIEVKSEQTTIVFGGKTLTGTLRGGSRRYVLAGQSSYVAKVKRRGPQILLRDDQNRTLCRAWIGKPTIRIRLTKDVADAYFLEPHGGTQTSPRGTATYDVKRHDELLGSTTFDRGLHYATVVHPDGAALYMGPSDRASALWAVLLVDELDEPLRYVLMAELGARGL